MLLFGIGRSRQLASALLAIILANYAFSIAAPKGTGFDPNTVFPAPTHMLPSIVNVADAGNGMGEEAGGMPACLLLMMLAIVFAA